MADRKSGRVASGLSFMTMGIRRIGGPTRPLPNSTNAMAPYASVGIFLAVAALAATAFCVVPGLLAHRRPNAMKSEAYECGVEPTSDVSGRFPIRFYLVAMLFVIFDVEAASFYPWAVEMRALRTYGLLEMIVFVIVLGIGYAYVWRKGGFVWR